jgi:hypothetical protein
MVSPTGAGRAGRMVFRWLQWRWAPRLVGFSGECSRRAPRGDEPGRAWGVGGPVREPDGSVGDPSRGRGRPGVGGAYRDSRSTRTWACVGGPGGRRAWIERERPTGCVNRRRWSGGGDVESAGRRVRLDSAASASCAPRVQRARAVLEGTASHETFETGAGARESVTRDPASRANGSPPE